MRTGIRRLRSLIGFLGFAQGIQVDWQIRRHRPAVSVDGYLIANDESAAYHIVESTSKLRRLAGYVPADAKAIVDVGAHSGLFARFAAERAPDANTICVEPDLALAPIIEGNLAAHGRWTVVSAAATDTHDSTAILYRSDRSTQTSSLHRTAVEEFDLDPRPVVVPTVTLDRVCADLPTVDVLKIDVQGAEQQVLAGAADTLVRTRVLLIEASLIDPDVHLLLARLHDLFGPPTLVNPVYAGADLAYVQPDPAAGGSGTESRPGGQPSLLP